MSHIPTEYRNPNTPRLPALPLALEAQISAKLRALRADQILIVTVTEEDENFSATFVDATIERFKAHDRARSPSFFSDTLERETLKPGWRWLVLNLVGQGAHLLARDVGAIESNAPGGQA